MKTESGGRSGNGRTRKFLGWLAQLLPPMLLVPLFLVPWDFATFGYWVAGAVAALLSLKTLVKVCFAPKSENRSGWRKHSIRPGLTLLIFTTAAIYMANHSAEITSKVDSLARSTAREMLRACRDHRACPPAPANWKDNGLRACRAIEFMRVCYQRSDDHKRFHVTARHRMDDELTIRGGILEDLQEERRCC